MLSDKPRAADSSRAQYFLHHDPDRGSTVPEPEPRFYSSNSRRDDRRGGGRRDVRGARRDDRGGNGRRRVNKHNSSGVRMP